MVRDGNVIAPGYDQELDELRSIQTHCGEFLVELEARERIHAYLDELRTTQRYPIYRALKHPLYPILRKIERIPENLHQYLTDIQRSCREIGDHIARNYFYYGAAA